MQNDTFYEPLNDGYIVSSISKAGKVFLERDTGDENVLKFYNHDGRSVIANQPTEVWGYDGENNLTIGVITLLLNQVMYKWYKHDQLVQSSSAWLYRVREPGIYSCHVDDGTDSALQSNSIQFVRISKEHTLPASASTPEDLMIDANAILYCEADKISHGSFGDVFKGLYKEQTVAVKRIKTKRWKHPVLKEATIHNKVSHPNVVRFVGAATREFEMLILTEFIEGPTMQSIIYDDAIYVSKQEKLRIAVDVVNAIAYLHGLGILHQDIKPENILVDKSSLQAKLCDLGLAKMGSLQLASTTAGVHIPGTLDYIPPERLLRRQRATSACDIWALGVTLAEWFVSSEPWCLLEADDEPLVHITRLMSERKRPPIFEANNLDILQQCVDYDPAQRPNAEKILHCFQSPDCTLNVI